MSFTAIFLSTLVIFCSTLALAQGKCPQHYDVVWREEINKDVPGGSPIVTIQNQDTSSMGVPVDNCKRVCIQDHSNCKAFVYDKVSGACTLLKDMDLIRNQSLGHNYLEWSCIYKTTFFPPRFRPTTPRFSRDPSAASSSSSSMPPTTPRHIIISTSASPVQPPADDMSRSLLYVILGCALGGGGLLILVILVLCAWCRHERKAEKEYHTEVDEMESDMNAIGECSMDNSINAPSFYYRHI